MTCDALGMSWPIQAGGEFSLIKGEAAAHASVIARSDRDPPVKPVGMGGNPIPRLHRNAASLLLP